MNSLYELSGEYLELLDMADNQEIDEEVFHDTLEAIEGEIEVKAEKIAIVLKEYTAQAAKIDTEIKRLTAMKNSVMSKSDWLKNYLQQNMETIGKTKFKTDLFSFNIQNNPPSVFIPDETKVPKEFLIPQPDKIDKTAIKDFLKGLDANDRCEWAELMQTQSLRIR